MPENASIGPCSQSCPAGIQPCQQPQGPSISRIDGSCPPAVGPCGHRRGRGMPDCPAGQGRPARADCAADTGNPARRCPPAAGAGFRGRLSRGGGADQKNLRISLVDAKLERRSTRKRRLDPVLDDRNPKVEKSPVFIDVFGRERHYATDERRSSAGMRRPSNAAGISPRAASATGASWCSLMTHTQTRPSGDLS